MAGLVYKGLIQYEDINNNIFFRLGGYTENKNTPIRTEDESTMVLKNKYEANCIL